MFKKSGFYCFGLIFSAELAYRARVEEQLKEADEDSDASEDEEEKERKEAEKRKERRKALLAKFKKVSPAKANYMQEQQVSSSKPKVSTSAADYDENADDTEKKFKIRGDRKGKKEKDAVIAEVDMFVDSPSKLVSSSSIKLAGVF